LETALLYLGRLRWFTLDMMESAGDIVVFSVSRDTACAECGRELFRGSMIMLNKERNPLCLTCADLDRLEYLSRGNGLGRENRRERRRGELDRFAAETGLPIWSASHFPAGRFSMGIFLAAEIESCVRLLDHAVHFILKRQRLDMQIG
jgi:hypothetical protein